MMQRKGWPAVSVAQMREVDRLMVDVYGISLLQMMENAGRQLAALAVEILSPAAAHRRVCVLAGAGGNGGGALVAARHLCNWGYAVDLLLSAPVEAYQAAAGHQLHILRQMGIEPLPPGQVPTQQAALLLDGLIGYSLDGAPRGRAAQLIAWANASGIRILALDLPSGLDADLGMPHGVCIQAHATLTLALPKMGLLQAAAEQWVGKLYLADISVPINLYTAPSLALRVPGFQDSRWVCL